MKRQTNLGDNPDFVIKPQGRHTSPRLLWGETTERDAMDIVRFLNEHWETVIGGIIATVIGGIIVKYWSVIIEKLKIERLLQLVWKTIIKKCYKCVGKRQTRAELLDLSQSINDSLAAIRHILILNYQSLQALKEDINKPMTEEQEDAYNTAYYNLRKSLEATDWKWSRIEGRHWEGMDDKDGKVRKRI